jgi:peptidyl-prolyl cis-trans isomerase C
MRLIISVVVFLSLNVVTANAQDADQLFVVRQSSDAVLVTVSGSPITASDLEFLAISHSVPKASRPAARKRLLEQLIDRRLMRSYLEKQRATPAASDIDAQVARIHELIRSGGDEPQAVLAKLGFDNARLRSEVALPLAWQIHVRRVVTNSQLRSFFKQYRQEYDGTEIRASQIFLKVAADADAATLKRADEEIRRIRQEIVDQKISFADAAKKYSAAPSAKRGGDVGFFPYRGKMLVDFSRAAFPLNAGDVSEPLRTRFGLHLLTVTDRRPGQLSLEDVRSLIYNALAQQAWTRLVAEQRKQAKIEWQTTPQ